MLLFLSSCTHDEYGSVLLNRFSAMGRRKGSRNKAGGDVKAKAIEKKREASLFPLLPTFVFLVGILV